MILELGGRFKNVKGKKHSRRFDARAELSNVACKLTMAWP
jgi:hypothetical protein